MYQKPPSRQLQADSAVRECHRRPRFFLSVSPSLACWLSPSWLLPHGHKMAETSVLKRGRKMKKGRYQPHLSPFTRKKNLCQFPQQASIYISLASTIYVPHPLNTSCKGDWEREYLAGHIATLNKTRIMLAKKREIDLGQTTNSACQRPKESSGRSFSSANPHWAPTRCQTLCHVL